MQHDTAGEPPPVAGTVRIMTDEPLQLSADPDDDAQSRLRRELSRRPWIVPATLLAAAAAYFLLRRR